MCTWACLRLLGLGRSLGGLVGTQACKQKVEGSIPPAHGSNRAPISGGGVLLEIEPRFPCRGNRGSVSRETAGQVALLKTLGRHCAAIAAAVARLRLHYGRFKFLKFRDHLIWLPKNLEYMLPSFRLRPMKNSCIS